MFSGFGKKSFTYFKLFSKDKIYHNQANTNIQKNVPFLHEHIPDIVQYIYYRTYRGLCDAWKVTICAIRGDSQLKINVLYDILPQNKTSLLIAIVTIL